MSDVFCDHLTFSTPVDEWESFRLAASPLFDTIGAQVEYETDRATLWRAGSGTCRAERKGLVMVVSATGAFLAGLRCARLFREYLSTISVRPHRVTRLDASLDRAEDTAPVLADLVRKVSSPDGLHVTRKRVKPGSCTRYVTQRADGLDTGSVYLGPVNADVRPVVYDKRKERTDAGLPDVGPLTRYECRVRSGVGPSLYDADRPAALFWHFMGDVLPVPVDAPAWSSHAEGFVLVRSPPPLPAARLLRRLDASADLLAIVRLAVQVGPSGLALLQSEIAKLYRWAERGAGVPPAATDLDLGLDSAVQVVAAGLSQSAAQPLAHC